MAKFKWAKTLNFIGVSAVLEKIQATQTHICIALTLVGVTSVGDVTPSCNRAPAVMFNMVINFP
jgi:hypothetical protein